MVVLLRPVCSCWRGLLRYLVDRRVSVHNNPKIYRLIHHKLLILCSSIVSSCTWSNSSCLVYEFLSLLHCLLRQRMGSAHNLLSQRRCMLIEFVCSFIYLQ
ncbi:hypothetical protein PanWU01x14_221940 [Parasponia andersonii]|uniref:Uncharacterized protein n=1 Tax=Parasponia andersonii TaxID=3476 RepID=A0A2P5BPD2_PARAD|nr:hypothetical protein PanWU01x14_221940 [Parasponia andersonii]